MPNLYFNIVSWAVAVASIGLPCFDWLPLQSVFVLMSMSHDNLHGVHLKLDPMHTSSAILGPCLKYQGPSSFYGRKLTCSRLL